MLSENTFNICFSLYQKGIENISAHDKVLFKVKFCKDLFPNYPRCLEHFTAHVISANRRIARMLSCLD